ncbi:YebF family protein [Sodalis sp. RH24]|uniref:YebF family protein n=1 Tax=unclassified Sodalis (in: enterobacteria) TaxID=2636512 RepID=UPI0039B5BB99
MHKTGIGLLGVIVIGMLLPSLAAAEDQTPQAAGQAAASQTSTEGASTTQQPAGQTQNTQPGTAAPAPANNAAPAQTPPANDAAPAPATPPAAAPVKKQAEEPPAADKPAPAKKAPAEKAKAEAAPATADNKTPAAKEPAKKSQPGKTYKVAACPDLNAPQVAELIKQDYTQNRFPHTDDDKKALGGDTIVAQVNPEDITGNGDNWQAPLKIRGQTADRAYAVNLDCEKGEISYSLQQ